MGKIKHMPYFYKNSTLTWYTYLIDDSSLLAQYTPEGIRINPAMLEETIFRERDRFDFKLTGNQITLKKAKT